MYGIRPLGPSLQAHARKSHCRWRGRAQAHEGLQLRRQSHRVLASARGRGLQYHQWLQEEEETVSPSARMRGSLLGSEEDCCFKWSVVQMGRAEGERSSER